MDKQYIPQLDESELLDQERIVIYQSLVRDLQWLITLGRFYVATSVMTLSRFCAMPQVGNLEKIK